MGLRHSNKNGIQLLKQNRPTGLGNTDSVAHHIWIYKVKSLSLNPLSRWSWLCFYGMLMLLQKHSPVTKRNCRKIALVLDLSGLRKQNKTVTEIQIHNHSQSDDNSSEVRLPPVPLLLATMCQIFSQPSAQVAISPAHSTPSICPSHQLSQSERPPLHQGGKQHEPL